MNSLPKKLQEARDKSAQDWCDTRTWIDKHVTTIYKEGADSMFEILAPEIEKLVEALRKIESKGGYDETGSAILAAMILSDWREFTGEK